MRTLIFSAFGLALFSGLTNAAPPKYTAKSDDKPPVLSNDAWKGAAKTPVQPEEIDRLIGREQAAEKITPSPRTTDEQFLRRVMLDLTGRLPLPADVTEFSADRDPGKRAKMIDKLLDGPEYAQHWARYWRDVFAAKVTDRRGQAIAYCARASAGIPSEPPPAPPARARPVRSGYHAA